MTDRPRALFVTSILQHARELASLVEHFASASWEVHALVGWQGETAEAMARRFADVGAHVLRPPRELAYGDPWEQRGDPSPQTEQQRPQRPSLKSRLGLLAYSARSFVALVAEFRRTRAYGRRLVQELEPDVVFASSYRSVGTFDQAIARAARERKALYCCFPLGPYIGEQWAVERRFRQLRDGEHDAYAFSADRTLPRRLLAALRPSWVREHGGMRIFSFLPKRMLAAWLAGLVGPNPWAQPSELFDICFVESELSRDFLLESGYDSSKIVVSGKPLLDRVFDQIEDPEWVRELYHALALEPGTGFLLFNVHPLWEHGQATEAEHWERTERLFAALSRTGLPVVLSLHPLCNPDHYVPRAERFGFRLPTQYSIAELQPFCGVVVSFPCSTNPLALVFDKPLVIYDDVGKLTLGDDPEGQRYKQPGATLVYDIDDLPAAVAARLAEPPRPTAVERRRACEEIERIVHPPGPRAAACGGVSSPDVLA